MNYLAVCNLVSPPAALINVLLSNAEQEMLRGARTPKRRREIDISRRLMRYGLSEYLQVPIDPLAWSIDGPRYECAESLLSLGLAHSKTHAVVAMGTRSRFGVDIETVDQDINWRKSVDVFFCEADAVWIDGTVSERFPLSPRHRFLVIWTAREAYAKYSSRSVLDDLSRPLLDFGGADDTSSLKVEVRLTRDYIISLCREDGAESEEWMFSDLGRGVSPGCEDVGDQFLISLRA